jgi:hypothetical protein
MDEGVRKQLTKLLNLATREGWKDDNEEQATTLEGIQALWPRLDEPTRVSLTIELAAYLGFSEDRTRQTLLLGDTIDLRRALRFQEREPRRLKDEGIYPRKGWLGNYLLYSQEDEAPLAYHFWVGAALIGAACRRNLFLDWGNHLVWPNYYLLIVGPPGCKKSAAIDAGVDIIQRENAIIHEADNDFPQDLRVRVMPNNTTPEMFLNMLKSVRAIDRRTDDPDERFTDAVALLANDEMVTLLGKSNFHSDKMVQVLTGLYGCPGHWEDAAITRGEFILRNVAITVIGGWTPEGIRTSVTREMFGGGFMSRCHFVERKKSGKLYWKAGYRDPITANKLAADLVRLTKASPAAMNLSKAAEHWYAEWYEMHNKVVAADYTMKNYMVRKPSHLLKMSIILALSDDLETRSISLDNLLLALKILELEQKRLPEMFNEFGATDSSLLVDYVYGIIAWYQTHNHSPISRTALLNRVYKRVHNKHTLDNCLAVLLDQDRIDVEKDPVSRKTYYSPRDPEETGMVEI